MLHNEKIIVYVGGKGRPTPKRQKQDIYGIF